MSDTRCMTTTYRVHGVSDDTDTCENCGKIELRSVVMLRVLDDGEETGELIYVGSTCASRLLAKRGKRVTAARVRDAAGAAARVLTEATKWAHEFAALTVNQYIAANANAYLNSTHGDVTAALNAARQGYLDVQHEAAAILAGKLTGTRFEQRLPTL